MISRLFAEHLWLWHTVWQSTVVLVIGLGGSLILKKRAVRAHLFLLLALVAAIVVPVLSVLVKQYQWGLLEAKSMSVVAENQPLVILDNFNRTAPGHGIKAGPTTTPAPTIPPIESRQVSATTEWSTLVVPLWIVLSAALLVRLTIRFLLGYRLAKRSVACDLPELAESIGKARTKLGLSGDIQARRSADTRSPVIWCWGAKPILLVPTEINDDIDWESVVCHELAHWKRRDHLSGLWAELIVCLLPWNPLIWLAQRRLVCLSEEACDDWVIASGQTGTRYARTLLNLTPQGRAALIPAVVSSEKGLAVRIRRILTDRCASPHSGTLWNLATTALVAGLVVIVAFAQAGPAQSTGMIRTELPHGAVIEQLASTSTIRGTILDPNGSPTNDVVYIVAPPMTPYGAEVYDRDGRFELPWSPAWFEEGQPRHLLAMKRCDENDEHEAALVAITDTTSPVTIHLEPAFALEATVVDPNGQPIPGYAATLSLDTQYKCRTALWATDITAPQVRLFWPIPFGPKYTLNIEAKGYAPKQITVDGTNRGKNVIDIGNVTLEPQDGAHGSTNAPMQNTERLKAFLELYRLNENEILKFVRPPFVLGRHQWLSKWTELPLAYGDDMNWGFEWDMELPPPRGGFSGTGYIDFILRWMLLVPRYDFNLQELLNRNLTLPRGDWIVRTGASLEQRMKALEEIIQAETGQPIHFEKRRTQREVVVVRGRYQLTSHPNGKQPNHVHLSWEDPTDDERHEEADSLAKLFERLEDDIAMKIVDETEPMPKTTIPYVAGNVAWIGDSPDVKREHLDGLLDNLAKTTGLTFTVEKRPADVWFISEQPAVAADQS